jgi:hypothetical protein
MWWIFGSAKQWKYKKINRYYPVPFNKIWSTLIKTKYPLFGSCKRLKLLNFVRLKVKTLRKRELKTTIFNTKSNDDGSKGNGEISKA